MLKRITLLVILIVLIKPAYDFGTKLYGDVTEFLNVNQVDIKNATTKSLTTLTNDVKETIATTSTSISEIKSTVSQLPDSVQTVEELADAFYYHFERWETDFEIQYVGSTADIENLIEKAVNNAAKRDQYIQGHLADRKIEFEYSRVEAKIKVHQQYLTNAGQEQYVDQQVANIVASITPESMSDFEKVKFVNDLIVKNTEYSTETSLSPHSACAVLQENKGVCQGYALLALKLLQTLGVETQYVVGEVYTGPHAWNLVKVDGKWYHLDTTWNDPTPDRGNVVRYEYFLMNDEKMKRDHSWKQTDYPAATSKKFAFMSKVDHAYEADGFIFYSNVEDNAILYRMNLATGEDTRLTDSRAQYIVGNGDWLYFSNYSNGAYLSKIRTDGSEESTLYREKVSNLFIEDGFLYFSTDVGLKKMEI